MTAWRADTRTHEEGRCAAACHRNRRTAAMAQDAPFRSHNCSMSLCDRRPWVDRRLGPDHHLLTIPVHRLQALREFHANPMPVGSVIHDWRHARETECPGERLSRQNQDSFPDARRGQRPFVLLNYAEQLHVGRSPASQRCRHPHNPWREPLCDQCLLEPAKANHGTFSVASMRLALAASAVGGNLGGSEAHQLRICVV